MLVVTKLFNIAVNDIRAKSVGCGRVLVVTELIMTGTQCNSRQEYFRLNVNENVVLQFGLLIDYMIWTDFSSKLGLFGKHLNLKQYPL